MTNNRNKKRKPRFDSTGELSRVMQVGMKEIQLPSHIDLRLEDVPFWNSIISEFSKSEWTDHQLEVAAMLARNMCDLNNTQCLMNKEGAIISVKNAQGKVINKKVNPRKQLLEMYTKNVLSLRRSLALHARASMGEPRNVLQRRQAVKELEGILDNIDDDDLIARPPKRIQ